MSDKVRDILGADPVPWLLASAEPYTRWATRALILGETGPAVEAERATVVADGDVVALVGELPAWGAGDFPGHHSPAFLPNRLNLLADMGVRGGDFASVERILDELLDHQDRSGRFESFGKAPGQPRPEWGSLLCDTNAITDVLLRFGRGDDPRLTHAIERIAADASATDQGVGWRCIPEKRSLFRGPGRVADTCPQVTLEGLRVASLIAEKDRGPLPLLEIARTPLEVWRRRTTERPYAFGHGYQFKSAKWPSFWYDVLYVLETLTRFPELWRGSHARKEDLIALAELAACLIDYNFDADGRLTPRRVYRGFERFSFGQKKLPSPFATARALIPLLRLSDLAEEIADVDVEALPGSKGGSGTPVPPRRAPRLCPTPTYVPAFPSARAVPRVLARHHIGTPHEPASVESIVADIVGIHATHPSTPFLALHARLAGFENARLERALYEQRSLVRVRCMRGSVFIVRHDLLSAVLAATRRPVIKYAREFALRRGIDAATTARFTDRVLALLAKRPLTTAQLRSELGDPPIDVAALVNLLAAESLVLRDRPQSGWRDRRWTYVPFADALPDVRPEGMSEEQADPLLLRAYVRAFGPATRRDAAWWSGIGIRRVDRALQSLGDEIVEVRLHESEEPFLMHAADVDELAAASLVEHPLIALLPRQDPLVMGYARKDRFVDDALRPYVFDRSSNATSTIVVNGTVIGVWDAWTDPSPGLSLFFPEPPGADVAEAVEERAADLARRLFGEEIPVERVASMVALPERPAGAFAHPLRT